MKLELTKEQKDILMNILLHEMQYCGNQNANIYKLLEDYKEECHKIYDILNESYVEGEV